jgi:ADP-heptose:LPS heptosyltransferase
VVVLGGPGEQDRVDRVVAGFGREVETVVGATSLGGLLGTLRRSALLLGNDSGPRHLAAAVGTPTVAVFTYANLADVAPLTRTWHRMTVSWTSACAVCGRRVLEGPCHCRASATWDVPEDEVRGLAVDLWEQVVAAGRQHRDTAPVPDVGAA